MNKIVEKASTVGLFAGCLVRVTETSTRKVVERHARVTKVHQKEVTVQGGETYHQDKYTFLRLA